VAVRSASRSHIPAAPAKPRRRRRRLWWYVAAAFVGPLFLIGLVLTYYYVTLSRVIEARLHGEQTRAFPRIFARPLELRVGQSLTDRQLIDRLNDLGYAHQPRVGQPGEFAIGRNAVALVVRGGPNDGAIVRVVFGPASARPGSPSTASVKRLDQNGKAKAVVTLEPPLLTAIVSDNREKRRKVPLAQIPLRVRQAVLAIEDRRFYDHPGVDPIRAVGAIVTNVRGDKPYLVGGSTLTQQLVKNLMLSPEKSMTRKLKEQFMAVIATQRLSKDEILELYLNEVYLGQRGSFAIHGVAEAARAYFGKDVINLRLSEAAALAGMIQLPQVYSPFRSIERCTERRNIVLNAMREEGYITADVAEETMAERLVAHARALEAEAPYFVDYVAQDLLARSVDMRTTVVDVHTTLDLHLQRLAQDAVRTGLGKVDEVLSRRRRKTGPAQAALIAIDPRNGDILAWVGGRSYSQSQFNRVLSARRQPGSVFKPFVYLAAFEQAFADGRTDLTPATVVTDEPTTFLYEDKNYEPGNFDNEYDGPITLRRALARSRNVAAVKVAEAAGYGHVADLWRKVGIGTPPQPYPSIALGVFEATPLEIATAYTIFPNGGEVQPLRGVMRIVAEGQSLEPAPLGKAHRVAGAEATYLVTNMLRSVVNEGTGASARAAGFQLDAAGKTGTTNDLRDAWFVGFTPELLTVVWVGLDDNRPLGLSGTQAALPIWTTFMTRALAGHESLPFEPPEGVVFAEIDPETGQLATPGCPHSLSESFLQGSAPAEFCALHGVP
jgi:1A family penicillin-binding protein